MVELLLLGVIAGSVFLVVGIVAAVVKLVFWLLVLPLRLLGGMLMLAMGVLLLPVLAIGAALAVMGMGLALLVPLLPFVLVGLLIWGVAKRPTAMAVAPRV
jgi:hypothetical protein